jgi:hypothetical protein
MRRTVLTLIIGAICFAGFVAIAGNNADPYSDIPQKNTPRKLQEAWLRFHESGLCQDVDAAFVFDNGGMQIWSRIESDKDYLKFQELFESSRALHRVELYTNRPREERESDSRDNPPPSLWQNYELRANLGDRAAQLSTYNEEQSAINLSSSDPLLKQRLFIYAEQVLHRNRKMERFALDIFALVRLAADPDIPAEIRLKAFAIGAAHAKEMEKNVGKLASDLEQAIPRPAKRKGRSALPPARETTSKPVLEEAEQLFGSTQSTARRVHRFINPEYYTVELRELRKSSLLESLKTLQQTVLQFQKTLAKSSRKLAAKDAS